MSQEDKQLLLQDLSARLPYRVIVDYAYNTFKNGLKEGKSVLLTCNILDIFISPRMNETNEYIKPYLRPMSSMTEEEKEEYNSHLSGIITGVDAANFMTWVYKRHLDIFHFIEKGLAIEVTENNNPYK